VITVAALGWWQADCMHVITGVRDPAASFPLASRVDDRAERRQANQAVAVSAAGLAVTGLIELVIAVLSGSVALLGDALHNLSDVSTSAAVFVGFRASRKPASERFPYGYERAEDLAGIGVAVVIWASAVVAGVESVAKLLRHGATHHIGWGIAAAVVGIVGNQLVARYKLVVGRRIQSATMIADAKHSWLDALSSAGALLGLLGVALGWRWADPVAGIVVTGFICHVGWAVSSDIAHRILDSVDPAVVAAAEAAATEIDGVLHAHARARWTGRTLRVEVEGWVDPQTSVADSDRIGRLVADRLAERLPQMRSFTWATRAVDIPIDGGPQRSW
jgi:cation diffusion facilitator family transporter